MLSDVRLQVLDELFVHFGAGRHRICRVHGRARLFAAILLHVYRLVSTFGAHLFDIILLRHMMVLLHPWRKNGMLLGRVRIRIADLPLLIFQF